MDTAGKAVLFSGLTVLISLTAVMLVPSPAFRSMALGIMLSVVFILAATLSLLPAVLTKLGPRVDKLSLPWVHSGEHRSPKFAAWAERLWRRPVAYGAVAVAVLVALSIPVFGLQTGMPSIKVVPEGDGSRTATQVQDAFGMGARRAAGRRTQGRRRAGRRDREDRRGRRPGHARHARPRRRRDGPGRPQARPVRQSRRRSHRPATRCRLSDGALVGGSVAENHDLEAALNAQTPLVIGVVLALGFLLLLVALQAPTAAVGVVTNLLAVGAAFGVARFIFQGHLADLLGLDPQGFLNAWAPVFFFAMVFAISMDYTVFLLSSAKEHWDRSHDPREAMVGGVAHSGRVVFAAAATMVAVFFTFALSGPLPPKEVGVMPEHRRPARRRPRSPAARAGRAATARQAVGLVAASRWTASCPTFASATRDDHGLQRLQAQELHGRHRGPRPVTAPAAWCLSMSARTQSGHGASHLARVTCRSASSSSASASCRPTAQSRSSARAAAARRWPRPRRAAPTWTPTTSPAA